MKAYIFDLDGTLLDSMGAWERIDVEFLQARGFEVPADYALTIASLRTREAAEYTINRFSLDESADSLIACWREMASHEYHDNIPLKPGALEYLSALRKKGVKLAVASSLSEPLRRIVLERHGLTEWFDVICSSEDVTRGKEFPDVYLHTARKLGVEPSDCVVFEDILPAVKSAKLAGMTVYAIYDEASKHQWEEIKKVADGVLYNFHSAPLPEKEARV